MPEGIRTPGLLIRSQTLYPAELRAHDAEWKRRCGEEGGIRTLDTLRYTSLAGMRFQPLTHLSSVVPGRCDVARGEGFEPPVGCPTAVFKTAAFNHSANPPFTAGAFLGLGPKSAKGSIGSPP